MGLTGFDYFALARNIWPINDTIKYTPAGSAIGFLDNVFGDPIPNFKKLLAEKNKDGTPKYPAYRIQMWYTDGHGLVPLSYLKTRLLKYEAIFKQHPDVKFYVSHTVEYTDKSASAVKQRVDAIKKYAPHSTPVNNMWTGVGTPGVMPETHKITEKPKAKVYMCSTDGLSCTQVMMDKWNKLHEDSVIRFLWASRFNLRNAAVPLPEPMKRTAAPTADYLKAVVRLASPSGLSAAPKPTFSGRFVPVKDPLILKAFCDDFPKDPRALKPLLICPSHASMLSVVTYKKQEVCKMKFFGNYPPNMHRFYAGSVTDMYGYEIADKAEKLSGSEIVWIRDGNTYYGPVNPGFRAGVERESSRE